MTLNQIVDSIADGFNRSLDIAFKERLKFVVKYWRARLIKQEIDKSNYNDLFYHTIIVPLQKVDIIDDCAIVAGCNVLRSVDKIPAPVRNKGVRSFAYVGSGTGNTRFEQVNLESLQIKLSSKYRKNTIFFDYRNDYLYIYNNLKLEFAAVRGVFADLDALKKFQCRDGICYSDNEKFPLPEDMVALLVNGLLSSELRMIGKEDKEVDIDIEANDAD